MSVEKYIVPVMADMFEKGEKPEYLFWVGCAGAFDDRYKKVSRAFARILNHVGVSYAVLGKEETCNGDPARRAGNEMLFQMQAQKVMETLGKYEVRKIISCCPHCFNIFKNEYPELGGNYEVVHHSQFLKILSQEGRLKVPKSGFLDKNITFHDPCYLGRGNDEYDAPRDVIKMLSSGITEMPRNKSFALCCGAGGAQMFKEAEPGKKEVYAERTEEALGTGAKIVATACPFCMTMLTDGIKYSNKEEEVRNLDIAEMVAESLGLI
jgi:Fe-S oxidoreductase